MKRIYICVVAVCVLLMTEHGFAVGTHKVPFVLDDNDIHYASAYLKNLGIITHDRLNHAMNRAEMMKVAIEIFKRIGGTPPANITHCFPDVSDEWFASYVCAGKDLRIIQGYMDGNFHPADPVTHSQALKIITEIFYEFSPFIYNNGDYLRDKEQFKEKDPGWYWPYFYLFAGEEIFDPKYVYHEDTMIMSHPDPDEPALRGYIFYYLQRMLERLENHPESIHPNYRSQSLSK